MESYKATLSSISFLLQADFDEKELQLKSFAPGFIDTHCHLDFLFERLKHNGSYSKFREDTKDPFPVSYEGCVTIFCKPWTFDKVCISVVVCIVTGECPSRALESYL